jgi:glycosyltransferase involved in cell wall biosynthesis
MGAQSKIISLDSTGKYRVLHVIRQGLVGGGESHLLTLIPKLNKGQIVSYVLSFTDGPMVSKLRELQIPVEVVTLSTTFDPALLKRIKRLVEAWQIDLVHAHGTRACINMMIPSKLLKLKLVYTIHGWSFHDDQSRFVQFLRKTAEKILVTLAHQNICVSNANHQTGVELISSFRANIIKNGIDLNTFNHTAAKKQYRDEWGIPANGLVVLFAARMTWQKQPQLMLKAFDQAAGQHPDLFLVMAGEGELSAEVGEMLKGLNNRDRVRLLPFYADMPGVLGSADIFALPSLWEGLPMSLLEAMAMGKAIVATAVDGTKELVSHGDNGILVQVGANLENDFAQALVSLARDTSFRKKIAVNAIETIIRDFNADGMAAQTSVVYQHCFTK